MRGVKLGKQSLTMALNFLTHITNISVRALSFTSLRSYCNYNFIGWFSTLLTDHNFFWHHSYLDTPGLAPQFFVQVRAVWAANNGSSLSQHVLEEN